nr:MAG TPA: Regulatory protein-modification, helix-turn-helix, transcriptional regulato, DNA [Bacteriophage sp.]
MDDKEIVIGAMKKRDYSQSLLAEEMGYSNASGVSGRIRGRQAMRCDTFWKFLDKLGFEVVVRSKRTDKTEWILSYDKEE